MVFMPGLLASWSCVAQSTQRIPWAGGRSIRGNARWLLLFAALLPCWWPAVSGAQQSPAQFQDLAARAAAARDRNDLPQAINLYNQAVNLKSDWAEGWFYLGLLQYSSDRFDGAIDAFDRFLQLDPDKPPALALRGLCEFEVGAYDNSLRDLDQAVKKGAADDPHNAQIIRYHYAQLLTRAGRFEDAFVQYQFFANLNIKNADLELGLGLAGTRNQALPKDIGEPARDVLEQAGEAGFAFLSGDTETADAQFSQLFVSNPAAPELHFFYAILFFRQGSDLAVDQFRAYLAAMPHDGFAHGMLAFALMLDGRFEEARPEAELAQRQAPDMQMAQIALARSLIETGSKPGTETDDDKRAGALIHQVLEQDPNNLEAHIALAALYSRIGDREDEDRERALCHNLAR